MDFEYMDFENTLRRILDEAASEYNAALRFLVFKFSDSENWVWHDTYHGDLQAYLAASELAEQEGGLEVYEGVHIAIAKLGTSEIMDEITVDIEFHIK